MKTNKMIAAELRRMADFLDRREAEAPKAVPVELTNMDDVMSMPFREFSERYLKVVHPTQGLIPLKLYDYHRRYVRALERNRFVIARKFRQGAFTTMTLGWMLWKIMYSTDQSYMVMTKTDREAIWCGQIVKQMYDQMPEHLRPDTNVRNYHEMRFADTGSSIYFGTPEATCGKSINFLLCDEMSFWKNADAHWKSMYPTLSTGGRCVILSTPNGKGEPKNPNFFWKTWEASIDNLNDFEPFTASYVEHPDYQNEEWVHQAKKNLGDKGWRQEVLQEFLD